MAAAVAGTTFFFLTMLERSLTGAEEDAPVAEGAKGEEVCWDLEGRRSGRVVEGRGAVRRSSICDNKKKEGSQLSVERGLL